MAKQDKAKKAGRPKKSKKSLWMRLGMLAFATYIAFILVDLQVDISLRRQQLAEIEANIEEQRISNKELERVLALGTDENYIERIARERLGFAYPDEKILIDASGS